MISRELQTARMTVLALDARSVQRCVARRQRNPLRPAWLLRARGETENLLFETGGGEARVTTSSRRDAASDGGDGSGVEDDDNGMNGRGGDVGLERRIESESR